VSAVLFFLFLAFVAWTTVRSIRKVARSDDLSILPRVEDEFRALIIDSEFPELCFDGRTADIVEERREGFTDRQTNTCILNSVHRFARNAHGEYFFFISEGSGRPFFKHVTQGNAKIALGRKYVAPTQVSG
jgi:hypothetical protein